MRLFAVLAFFALAACNQDFDPYDSLLDYRVLALRAQSPSLAPSERTYVDALEFIPDSGGTPEHRWSWCPISLGANAGYECAIAEAELQAAIDRSLQDESFIVPPYALSTTSSAAFAHEIPPLILRGVCAALKQASLPEVLAPPSCEEYFPIQIRLDAKLGDKSISSVKELRLLYSADDPKNNNPTFDKVQIGSADEPILPLRDFPETETFTATRGKKYYFQLAFPESNAEPFVEPPEVAGGPPLQKREVLAITWFAEGGGMADTRTTFISGEIPLDVAGFNEWTAPKAVDYPDSSVRLFFVMRDGRGGLGWIERRIELAQ